MPPTTSPVPFWQDTEWLKILITAFVTVVFTEPVKVWLHNRSKLRQMRKFVMAEAVHNLAALNRIRELCRQNPDISKRPKQMRDLAIHTLRNSAHHKAQDDFYLFNRMPEKLMIADLYKNCDWLKDISILNESDPLLLIDIFILAALDYINSHGVTRRLASGTDSPFLLRSIKPTLLRQMKDSWHDMQTDIETIQQRARDD